MQNTITALERLPDLEAYIDRESALELSRRSMLGAPVYTVISLIMLAGTPMLIDYGPWAFAEVVLLLAIGAVRLLFAHGFEKRYDKIGERAVIQFSILTAMQSLTLGVLSAMVIWQYWAAQEVVLTIVLSAGCIAAGTSALSVRRSAQLIFLACVLAPFGIAVYLVGGLAQAVIIVGFLSLMAFLVQDGGLAKQAYTKRLKEHYGEKIAQRRAALELQAKQEFIKEAGHHICSPVNSIIGMTALLMDEMHSERSREIAENIRESGNSLLSFISDLPGTIKSRHETPEVKLATLNLRDCIKDTMDLYLLDATEKGIDLTIHLEDIPEEVTDCDQYQLKQVLANLMANALEYTDKGSITLSASSENMHDGTVLIEFSLADTGPGIPVEHRETVFYPFGEKGAKTSGKFGGDGLGLPLCKSLVELLGGDIWIEDNDGHGTVVKFTIRAEVDPSDSTLRVDTDSSKQQESAEVYDISATHGDNVSQLHPHRILIVDDDDIHRRIVCMQLQKMGYYADEAADGEESIAAVMHGDYDLIFMDMRMPNMDGVEATHWIRQRFNDNGLRIIALTGDATIEAREKCMRAGMDNFITKPVQIKDLEAVVRNTRHDQLRPVESKSAPQLTKKVNH